MPISFRCPHCNGALKVKEELAGKRGKCPHCGQSMTVPRRSQPGVTCPVCGRALPSDGSSCPHCGGGKAAASRKKKKPRRRGAASRSTIGSNIVKPILILVVLGGLGYVGWQYGPGLYEKYFGKKAPDLKKERPPTAKGAEPAAQEDAGPEPEALPVAGDEAPAAGTIRISPKDHARMVFVPGGLYAGVWIGHGFWIDQYEVTSKRYQRFKSPPSSSKRPDEPVTGISYDEAVKFAEWAGKSLPSLDQWSAAAQGRRPKWFPWGGTFNPGKCYVGQNLHDVGSFPDDRSPFGCADMAGNALELTTAAIGHHAAAAGIADIGRYRDKHVCSPVYSFEFVKKTGPLPPNVGFRCVVQTKFPAPKPVVACLAAAPERGGSLTIGWGQTPMPPPNDLTCFGNVRKAPPKFSTGPRYGKPIRGTRKYLTVWTGSAQRDFRAAHCRITLMLSDRSYDPLVITLAVDDQPMLDAQLVVPCMDEKSAVFRAVAVAANTLISQVKKGARISLAVKSSRTTHELLAKWGQIEFYQNKLPRAGSSALYPPSHHEFIEQLEPLWGSNPQVREAAITALVRRGVPKDGPAIGGEPMTGFFLRGLPQKEFTAFIRRAGQMQAKSAAPALVAIATDANIGKTSRQGALKALAQIQAGWTAKPLAEHLGRGDQALEKEICGVIGKLRDRRAVEPLLESLKRHGSLQNLHSRVRALGEIGDLRAADELLKHLKPEEKTSAVVAWALGKIRARAAIQPLANALGSPHKEVHQQAACALGQFGKFGAKSLLDALENDSLPVTAREAVAEQLGEIRHPLAFDALRRLMLRRGTEKELGIRCAAAIALAKVTGADRALEPMSKLLLNPRTPVQLVRATARALAITNHVDAVPPLHKLLRRRSTKGETVVAVSQALVQLEAWQALSDIRRAWKHRARGPRYDKRMGTCVWQMKNKKRHE